MNEADRLEALLDSALEATFPASDPPALFAVADGYAELVHDVAVDRPELP